MHRVAVLALDGVYPFELSIPKRIFGTATDPHGHPLYDVTTFSLDGRPVATDADFTIAVEHDAGLLTTADTLVIPPFAGCDQVDHDWLPEPLATALAHRRPGTRIVSICTAAYVLAAAGILDGRPATTHWNQARHFQQTFPAIDLRPDVLFVDDGDVLTAAGVAAGIDLCLHLVRRDHGSEVANRVARLCIVPPWRDGGQAQFVHRPVPEPDIATTTALRQWALDRLHQPLTLSTLAAEARMSVRTLSRRFRDEVGMTPGQWLTQQRIQHARHLLETTDLPVDRVATEAGMGTGASLRQHLTAAVGLSPTAYRHRFRGTPAPVPFQAGSSAR
ncbi:GlxA family transcriptional regulator [Phytohabitans houttuyneae]|uniref:AraC family transcriptional regulator n=1 Tax=Phytohabitans houttuyneae TaxID=1076126 RepID=A0A6V8K2P0_9ACTN|nr:helix-turn-helix domain-containing protein [Phytohabitans houttuyneae]GFJ77984.1 AraC family transcriptional regulator [Phytohabitans houttuyneae]